MGGSLFFAPKLREPLVEDEAARSIREKHQSPFEAQRHESFIERLELQPPHPDELCRKA